VEFAPSLPCSAPGFFVLRTASKFYQTKNQALDEFSSARDWRNAGA